MFIYVVVPGPAGYVHFPRVSNSRSEPTVDSDAQITPGSQASTSEPTPDSEPKVAEPAPAIDVEKRTFETPGCDELAPRSEPTITKPAPSSDFQATSI